ncbi:MAG: type II secretion system protein [Candidatus Curtissbacteria bacterium]
MSLKKEKTIHFSLLTIDLRGQSLIEVVVALAVVIMLAVSLVATTLLVQKASKNAQNTTQATKLVQQNIEQVRIFRDRGVTGFDALPDSGCHKLNTVNADPAAWTVSSLASCEGNPPSGSESVVFENVTFNRWLSFTSPSSRRKTVTVTVSWNDSGGNHEVTNQTVLSKLCQSSVLDDSCLDDDD